MDFISTNFLRAVFCASLYSWGLAASLYDSDDNECIVNGSTSLLQANFELLAHSKKALHKVNSATKPENVALELPDLVERPITFITIVTANDIGAFDHNLGKSQLWIDRNKLPHQWLIYNNTHQRSISFIYAQETQKAYHDLIVYLHPDILLPPDWYMNAMWKLAEIEAVDPQWGVLGTAGVPLVWKPYIFIGNRLAKRIASNITDCFANYSSGMDNMEMQSLDEQFLMLRRGGPVRFDPMMPGLDLYGSDIVLTARQNGLKSYLLHTHLLHKVFDGNGELVSKEEFCSKVNSATYKQRVLATMTYVQGKWGTSGLLPIYGTSFTLTATALGANKCLESAEPCCRL